MALMSDVELPVAHDRAQVAGGIARRVHRTLDLTSRGRAAYID